MFKILEGEWRANVQSEAYWKKNTYDWLRLQRQTGWSVFENEENEKGYTDVNFYR